MHSDERRSPVSDRATQMRIYHAMTRLIQARDELRELREKLEFQRRRVDRVVDELGDMLQEWQAEREKEPAPPPELVEDLNLSEDP